VNPVAKEVSGIVKYSLAHNGSKIKAESEEKGSVAFDIPAIHERGDALDLALRVNFAQDAVEALSKMGADEIMLEGNAPTQPFVLTAADRSSGVDALIVIMPMHLGK
jgi:DNA polymerase III sliding clamp (beta) subunit (PCNA family)